MYDIFNTRTQELCTTRNERNEMGNLEIHLGAVQLVSPQEVGSTTELLKQTYAVSDSNSIDFNQYKFDEDSAVNGIVSHNMLTLEFCAGVISDLVGRSNSIKYIEANFIEPLYRGDSVDFTCAIKRDFDRQEGNIQFVGKVGERVVIIGHSIVIFAI